MSSTDNSIAVARRQVQEAEWRVVRQIEMVEDLVRHRFMAEAEAARDRLAGMKRELEEARGHLKAALGDAGTTGAGRREQPALQASR